MTNLLRFLAYLSQDAINEIFYAHSAAQIAEIAGCTEADIRRYLAW